MDARTRLCIEVQWIKLQADPELLEGSDLWLAPVEFRESLVLRVNGKNLGGRLALFYVNK